MKYSPSFYSITVLVALLLIPNILFAETLLTIKYRPDPVDIDKPYFEYFNTSSSFIRDAWYDKANKYMIVNLAGTNYHYCGLDSSTWQEFKNAESYGSFYRSTIKGNFDCRIFPVPEY